ncbi:MAG: sigma-70 family RNA polymerase sigma factor [Gammaproteobacteria bacterium]|nr:sigma-70 family RNA polymerase sigma factor [Gammaproteobacteria bacterium]
MTGDATQLLHAWRAGDTAARDRLVALLYQELRALAGRQFERERGEHTLQPTALVNEAYQRLAALDRIDWQGRAHFIGVAARLMREILIDHARRRQASKRDGGERVTLFTNLPAQQDALDVLDLENALLRLETIAPDKARVVELRFFGGLSIEDTAEAMALSPATVKRHWQAARVWLFDALSHGSGETPEAGAGSAP